MRYVVFVRVFIYDFYSMIYLRCEESRAVYGRLQRRVQPSPPAGASVRCHHAALTRPNVLHSRKPILTLIQLLRLPGAFLSKCERGRGGKEKHGAGCQCRVRFCVKSLAAAAAAAISLRLNQCTVCVRALLGQRIGWT